MARYNLPEHPDDSHQRQQQTQQIATIGQQISAPLRDLSSQLTSLKNEIESNNEKIQRSKDEYRNSSLSWVKLSTVVSGTLALSSLLVSLVTLVILRNQLSIMKLDQRAWIFMKVTGVHIEENKPITANVRITNTGKTFAKAPEVDVVVEKVPADSSPSFDYSKLHEGGSLGTMAPGGWADKPYSWLGNLTPDKLSDPPPLLTKEENEEFRNGKAYLAVFGKVTYRDVYGTPRWVHFCQWFPAKAGGSYRSKKCVEYNDVDNN